MPLHRLRGQIAVVSLYFMFALYALFSTPLLAGASVVYDNWTVTNDVIDGQNLNNGYVEGYFESSPSCTDGVNCEKPGHDILADNASYKPSNAICEYDGGQNYQDCQSIDSIILIRDLDPYVGFETMEIIQTSYD